MKCFGTDQGLVHNDIKAGNILYRAADSRAVLRLAPSESCIQQYIAWFFGAAVLKLDVKSIWGSDAG